MKVYKMYANVDFCCVGEKPVTAMFEAQFEADSLIDALEHWDRFIWNCQQYFRFDSYFVVPQIIFKDNEPMSKKYYFKVVLGSATLWNNWAC